MLMNLGIGDNGVRILKDETVKSILAVSTRPAGLGGYSLGLTAPLAEKDGENAWFGHGGPPPGAASNRGCLAVACHGDFAGWMDRNGCIAVFLCA